MAANFSAFASSIYCILSINFLHIFSSKNTRIVTEAMPFKSTFASCDGDIRLANVVAGRGDGVVDRLEGVVRRG